MRKLIALAFAAAAGFMSIDGASAQYYYQDARPNCGYDYRWSNRAQACVPLRREYYAPPVQRYYDPGPRLYVQPRYEPRYEERGCPRNYAYVRGQGCRPNFR